MVTQGHAPGASIPGFIEHFMLIIPPAGFGASAKHFRMDEIPGLEFGFLKGVTDEYT